MQRLWSIVDHRQKTTEWSCKVIYGMLLSGIALGFSTASRIMLDVELPFAFGLVAVVFAAGWGGALPAFVVTGVTIPAAVLLSAHHPFVNSINIAVIAIFSVTLAIFGARMTSLRERADFEAQRALKREAFLQSIFDRTPAAILIADGQGQVVAINASARHIFNITADHAGQITVSEILQTLGRTAVPSEEHRVVVRGDGKHLSLTLSNTNLPLAGRVFRTVYIRDDTATIAAAEQLALLQAELQQLARATALGQLGSAIAHELNQPLALAANFATVAKTLVARGHDNGETSEALEATLQQIFRAGEVLNRLREFVRHGPLQAHWLGTHQMLSDGVSLGGFAIRRARAELLVKLDPNAGELLGDAVQIQQVILNLLSNAADAVAGLAIRKIAVSMRIDPPDRLRVIIADTGCGIPSGMESSVFKPFRTTKTHGLGVGLAICRTIIEAHGGVIGCKPGDDGGAVFWFTLPWRAADGRCSHAA